MLHTLAQALEKVERVKATYDRCSQVGAFDTVISFGTYPPRLAVAICGYLYLNCHCCCCCYMFCISEWSLTHQRL